jgi:hypothetical protein
MNPIKQYSTKTHKDKDERHEPKSNNTQREHIKIKMSNMNPIKQYSTKTHKDKDERHEPNQTILNENTKN